MQQSDILAPVKSKFVTQVFWNSDVLFRSVCVPPRKANLPSTCVAFCEKNLCSAPKQKKKKVVLSVSYWFSLIHSRVCWTLSSLSKARQSKLSHGFLTVCRWADREGKTLTTWTSWLCSAFDSCWNLYGLMSISEETWPWYALQTKKIIGSGPN